MDAPLRPTAPAHGGGREHIPAVPRDLLADGPPATPFRDLRAGTRTADAAMVIATTDFFAPVVDGSRDVGRVAATNAIRRGRAAPGSAPRPRAAVRSHRTRGPAWRAALVPPGPPPPTRAADAEPGPGRAG